MRQRETGSAAVQVELPAAAAGCCARGSSSNSSSSNEAAGSSSSGCPHLRCVIKHQARGHPLQAAVGRGAGGQPAAHAVLACMGHVGWGWLG